MFRQHDVKRHIFFMFLYVEYYKEIVICYAFCAYLECAKGLCCHWNNVVEPLHLFQK